MKFASVTVGLIRRTEYRLAASTVSRNMRPSSWAHSGGAPAHGAAKGTVIAASSTAPAASPEARRRVMRRCTSTVLSALAVPQHNSAYFPDSQERRASGVRTMRPTSTANSGRCRGRP
ncbi:Uncharacterised protein [Mycobacteroides abscessus subsp. abscessus]|nr:Uncharacterised protein [Mycobacteroides abscessus subsp. abscessus]